MNVQYTVQRNVAASNRPGGPTNTRIAMVLFKMPNETVGRTLAINEEQLKFEGGGDPEREKAVIERELAAVLGQMTAGAPGDMVLTPS